jgi:hypothetical protein
VEENVIKDKDMVCKLYENLIKNKKEKQEWEDYQNYAQSLTQMSAYKDAKNVLKRCIYSIKNQ